jgi:hypothetical protein
MDTDQKLESRSLRVWGLHESRATQAAFIMVVAGALFLSIGEIYILKGYGDLGGLLKSLGEAFVPSAIVAFFYAYWVRKGFVEEVRRSLKQLIETQFSQFAAVQEAGVRTIYQPNQRFDKVLEEMSKATTTIRILSTWIPNLEAMQRAIVEAAKRGCKIQVLLLHPDSEAAKLRAADLNCKKKDYVQNQIRNCWDQLQHTLEQNEGKKDETNGKPAVHNVQVRFFSNSAPVIMMFGCDEAYFFTLLLKKLAYELHVIETSGIGKNTLGFELNEYFEKLWDDAEPNEKYPIRTSTLQASQP